MTENKDLAKSCQDEESLGGRHVMMPNSASTLDAGTFEEIKTELDTVVRTREI